MRVRVKNESKISDSFSDSLRNVKSEIFFNSNTHDNMINFGQENISEIDRESNLS